MAKEPLQVRHLHAQPFESSDPRQRAIDYVVDRQRLLERQLSVGSGFPLVVLNAERHWVRHGQIREPTALAQMQFDVNREESACPQGRDRAALVANLPLEEQPLP